MNKDSILKKLAVIGANTLLGGMLGGGLGAVIGAVCSVDDGVIESFFDKITGRNKTSSGVSKFFDQTLEEYFSKEESAPLLSNLRIKAEREKESSVSSATSVTTKYNSTVELLKKIVISRKGYLLHVTELENLPYIVKYGLLSMKTVKEKGLKPKMITDELSNALDAEKSLDSYVHLAFDESYSMFSAKIYHGILRKPVIIKVSPEVLDLNGIKISDTNASARYSKIGDVKDVINDIDFDKLYIPNDAIRSFERFNSLKRFKQAEVLVKNCIPVKFFKEILVPQHTLGSLNGLLGNLNVREKNTIELLKPFFARGVYEF